MCERNLHILEKCTPYITGKSTCTKLGAPRGEAMAETPQNIFFLFFYQGVICDLSSFKDIEHYYVLSILVRHYKYVSKVRFI